MTRQPPQDTPRRLPFLPPPPAPRPSSRRAVILLGAVAALWLVRWALGRLAPESTATDLAGLALFLAVAVAVFLGLRWLWRRLTYRVSVRLFLSYLLIGLVPFPLLGLLGIISGYVLVGQYGSIRVGQENEKLLEHLSATAVSALHELEVRGGDTALALLHVPELEGAGRSLRTLALLADGERAWRAPAGLRRSSRCRDGRPRRASAASCSTASDRTRPWWRATGPGSRRCSSPSTGPRPRRCRATAGSTSGSWCGTLKPDAATGRAPA